MARQGTVDVFFLNTAHFGHVIPSGLPSHVREGWRSDDRSDTEGCVVCVGSDGVRGDTGGCIALSATTATLERSRSTM